MRYSVPDEIQEIFDTIVENRIADLHHPDHNCEPIVKWAEGLWSSRYWIRGRDHNARIFVDLRYKPVITFDRFIVSLEDETCFEQIDRYISLFMNCEYQDIGVPNA